MAIFRAETKHITRSKKHNVVAAAAYRAGEKLTDTNKFNPAAITHDYSKKQGVVATGIILPNSLIAQNFKIDRQELWSNVEQSETTTRSVKGSRLKQTARLAREWLLALPSELSDDENEQLTREFTEKLVNDLGVIADYAIHKPSPDDIKPKKFVGDDDKRTPIAPDSRNIHAHIMFTTRKAELNADNELIFTDKADSERSEKWRQEQKLGNGGDYLKEIRGMWADMLNTRLEQKNILPVTAKSYAELGLDIEPQLKQGKNATVMSRFHLNNDNNDTTIGHNNEIRKRNRAVIKSATISSTNKSSSQITFAASSCYDSFTHADARKRGARERESAIDRASTAIDRASGTINAANAEYDRFAEFCTNETRVVSAREQRIKQREQLVTENFSNERDAESGLNAASNCYKRNIKQIAAHLAWRNEDSKKYDSRQKSALDTFYKTLNVPNFSSDMTNYVQPQIWTDTVQNALTDKHITENPHIVAIVLDPASEKARYDARTSHSAFNLETVLSATLDARTLNTASQEHITTVNSNSRRRP